MSRLNHKIVSAEITRLLTAHPDTRYTDIIDLTVLHLACNPSTVRNAVTRMRIDNLIVGSGKPKSMLYRLTNRGERTLEVKQVVTKADTRATMNRPKHASGIAQFVWEAGRI